MRDLITYCKDVTKLLPEVAKTLPDFLTLDIDGNANGFAITKTPTVRKGNKTLSLVRCSVAEAKLLASLASVTVLANVEAGGDVLAAMSTTGRAKYDAVHDQSVVVTLLEDGTEFSHKPPALIGAFA